MVDGFSLVCPACGRGQDLSSGLTPNVDGQLICASCGGEIPIPLAAPDDSLGDTTTSQTDLPTIVDAQHKVHPAGADSIESLLGDCGSGRYAEQETIGKGGMGEIVLCVEQNVRREVAMKRLLPTAAKHARQRARFVQEAQVTGQLEHPNIVPIHELGRDEQGAIYFTMKLVKGRSLAEILAAARDGEETHSLGEFLQMFLKVCDGVAFAHFRGVVHRDLKPANIMVGDFGEVLVMDWGIARILGRDEIADETGVQSSRQDAPLSGLHTMDGAIMGSPQYMPPEQAAGEIDKIDHRSDIYSLGAILYEILTLKRPVAGKTAQAIVNKVVRGNIPPPEKRTPDREIPRELSAVAMKCLAKYRRDRYVSVPDLQRDVSLYLEGRSVSAAPDTFTQAFVKLIKRNKPVSLAVAAAAVILIAVVSVAFIRVTGAMQRAITERQAAQDARDEQRATALAASEQLARQAVRAADERRFAVADVRADASVKVMPDGPWGHYALGVVAFEKKDLAGAHQHFEKAIELDASHKLSKQLLDIIRDKEGDLAELEKIVAQADKSTDWRSLATAGDKLIRLQRYSDALKVCRRASELIARQADVPVNVRDALKDNLARAKGCVKMKGFYESVRHLSASQQAERLKTKLKEIYGPGLKFGKTPEMGSLLGINISGNQGQVPWLDPLRGLPLRELDCNRTSVTDLSPLKGMPLQHLNIHSTPVTDLSSLRGMPLKELNIDSTKVADLSPLKGMPLRSLRCAGTGVSDLEPLKGMGLTLLYCHNTRVSDLTPLEGMPLEQLRITDTKVKDLGSLKGMKLTRLDLSRRSALTSLKGIEGMPLTELRLGDCRKLRGDLSALKGMKLTRLHLNGCSSLTSLKGIEGMPLTDLHFGGSSMGKCDALRGDLSVLKGMKLTKLNLHGYPLLTSLKGIEGMLLKSLDLRGTKVTDLSPLKGMKLTKLNLGGCSALTSLKGLESMPLTELDLQNCKALRGDLSALKGMKLTSLDLDGCLALTSLKGLEGMPLTELDLQNCKALRGDLSVLGGMPLTSLECHNTRVSDLSPLKGMRLTHLDISNTSVSDLSPLKGMKLTSLEVQGCSALTSLKGIEGMKLQEFLCSGTGISDLTPLKGMKLTRLECHSTRVSDLSPLKGMGLYQLRCDGTLVGDLGPLRGMPLDRFYAFKTKVADLSPLTGMPLKDLQLWETKVTDLTPLAGMMLKQFVFTPKNITNGIEIIRRMKSIRDIRTSWRLHVSGMKPEEFWKKYDAGEFK